MYLNGFKTPYLGSITCTYLHENIVRKSGFLTDNNNKLIVVQCRRRVSRMYFSGKRANAGSPEMKHLGRKNQMENQEV